MEDKECTEKSGTGFGKLSDFFKGGKGGKIIVAVGLIGMALIPVSYTHLDVYKRQLHHCGIGCGEKRLF